MAPSCNALTTTEDDLPGPNPLQSSSYIPQGFPKKMSHETAKTSGCPSVCVPRKIDWELSTELSNFFRSNLHDLLSLDPSQLGLDRIHTSLQKTMLTPCKDVKSFGGKYIVGCKIHDGHKYVCVNKLLEDIEQHRVSI